MITVLPTAGSTGWADRMSGSGSGSRAGSGRLARVIATRGGKAAPEAPFVIEHREALIYMLCEAAELEHGLMCQYLFAAFSLRSSRTLSATSGWKNRVLKSSFCTSSRVIPW